MDDIDPKRKEKIKRITRFGMKLGLIVIDYLI